MIDTLFGKREETIDVRAEREEGARGIPVAAKGLEMGVEADAVERGQQQQQAPHRPHVLHQLLRLPRHQVPLRMQLAPHRPIERRQ